jgi:hypothetical protein
MKMLAPMARNGLFLVLGVVVLWLGVFLTGLYRPMHYAVRHNLPELVKYLAQRGYVEEKELSFDGGYTTPLEIAASLGERPIVDFLLDSGADIRFPEGNVPDVLRASINHPDLTAHLIYDRNIDPIAMIAEHDPDVLRAMNGDPVALAVIKTRGENGDSFMTVIVSEMYRKGIGVAKDESAARFWYADYADGQEAAGLYGAVMHERNPSAFDKLKEKAENGDRHAQVFLAEIYQHGCGMCYGGITQDLEQSLKWYLKAADQGSIQAQEEVAGFYRGTKAINKENGEERYIVGHMPTSADYMQCYAWYSILASEAASLDDDDRMNQYSRGRDSCGQKLSDEDRRDAGRSAAEWRPSPPAVGKWEK